MRSGQVDSTSNFASGVLVALAGAGAGFAVTYAVKHYVPGLWLLWFGSGAVIAGLVRLSPGVVPVPGLGRSRFQPIHVEDTARVIVAALEDTSTSGQRFDLGGPRYWTYREITEEVLRALDKRRVIVPMPVPLIRLVAATAELVRLPFPVATDQLRQLRLDNIGPLDLIPTRFGFTPRDMGGQLGYLKQSRREQADPRRWGTAPAG